MKDLGNEKGIGIVIVLMVLTVVSLAGAGLLIQSRLDTVLTGAQRNHNRLFNVADGAASLGYTKVGVSESPDFLAESSLKSIWSAQDAGAFGTWGASVGVRGYDTHPELLAGWELGSDSGYHVEFWVAEGTCTRVSAGTGALSAVYMPAIKFSRN